MSLLTSTIWAMEPTALQRYASLTANLSQHDLSQVESIQSQLGDSVEPTMTNGIARIPVRGPLTKSVGLIEAILGFSSTQEIQTAVEQAAMDESVKQIVLEVDSPGGSVSGLAELADAIFTARDTKPVIAQVDGMAASAGYQIASQASEIFAGREDMVGSIGVKLMLYDFSEAFQKEGIEAVPIDTGKFKSAGEMGTEITEEQRADFQRLVDQYFDGFKNAIIRGRNMTEASVDEVADGRVFVGSEAQSLGLIDGVQTLRETLSQLSQQNRQRSRLTQARLKLAETDL